MAKTFSNVTGLWLYQHSTYVLNSSATYTNFNSMKKINVQIPDITAVTDCDEKDHDALQPFFLCNTALQRWYVRLLSALDRSSVRQDFVQQQLTTLSSILDGTATIDADTPFFTPGQPNLGASQ